MHSAGSCKSYTHVIAEHSCWYKSTREHSCWYKSIHELFIRVHLSLTKVLASCISSPVPPDEHSLLSLTQGKGLNGTHQFLLPYLSLLKQVLPHTHTHTQIACDNLPYFALIHKIGHQMP